MGRSLGIGTKKYLPFFMLSVICLLMSTPFTDFSLNYVHNCYNNNASYVQIKTIKMYSESLTYNSTIFSNLPKINESDMAFLSDIDDIYNIYYESRIQGILLINLTLHDWDLKTYFSYNILDILLADNYNNFLENNIHYSVNKISLLNNRSVFICGSFKTEMLDINQSIILSINNITRKLVISGIIDAPHEEHMIIISKEIMQYYNVSINKIYNTAWLKFKNIEKIENIDNGIKKYNTNWSIFYDSETIKKTLIWLKIIDYRHIIILSIFFFNIILIIKFYKYKNIIKKYKNKIIFILFIHLIINFLINIENIDIIQIKKPFASYYIEYNISANILDYIKNFMYSIIFMIFILIIYDKLIYRYKKPLVILKT
jgi:hypothetical protein